jgi:hypothetical protein
MDPDQALKDLRDAFQIIDTTHLFNETLDAYHTVRDSSQALDEWLSKGGFLPKAWQRQ